MSTLDLSLVRRLLPSYDDLPDLVPPPQTAKILNYQEQSLAADRCGARRLGLGFVRVGRKIMYPRTEIASFLIRNSVGITTETGHLKGR